MLDYGSRSACCRAPIGLKKVKKNNILKTAWFCTKCRKTGISIISNDDLNVKPNGGKFSEEAHDF